MKKTILLFGFAPYINKTTILIIALLMVFCDQINAQIITTVVGIGVPGYSGDGGAATAAKLDQPIFVSIDLSGNLYISDSNRIRKVDGSGIITTIAGNGLIGISGDGGPATAAELIAGAGGLAVDDSDNVYLSSGTAYSRVRKINTFNIINKIVGSTPGYSGNGGPATAAQLDLLPEAEDLAVDTSGNLYISDNLNAVIRKVNKTGIITTIAGNGLFGYSGDGGPATDARLVGPLGIATDGSGNLYIADQWRIRKVTTGGIITTIGGIGTGGYTGDNGPATAAELFPGAMAVDGSGNIFITDIIDNVVRKINTAGIITTFAGNGITHGFSGDGGSATAAELNGPTGVAVDESGNVYIADINNNRIRKVSAGTSSVNKIERNSDTSSLLLVCPNPTSGIFTLTLLSPTEQDAPITITNTLGQKVKDS